MNRIWLLAALNEHALAALSIGRLLSRFLVNSSVYCWHAELI